MTSNTITGTVTATKHAGTSYYGNPSYWVTIETPAGDTITLRTSANVSFAYACENREYRESAHVFHLTRAGRIRYAVTIANYLATTDGRDADARAIHDMRASA